VVSLPDPRRGPQQVWASTFPNPSDAAGLHQFTDRERDAVLIHPVIKAPE